MSVSPPHDRVLETAGLLPVGGELGFVPAGDLLPGLITASLDRAGRRARRLAEAQSRGAALTLGLGPQEPGLADRLAWWPHGRPDRSPAAVVSSRLGRALDRRPEWFAALACACRDAGGDRTGMLSVAGTTTARFLPRCADLFGLELFACRVTTSWTAFRTSVLARPDPAESPGLVLSPPADPESASSGFEPVRDLLTLALAGRATVLSLRPGGNLDRLLRGRLAESRRGTVRLAVGGGLVPEPLAGELIRLGAGHWSPPRHVASSASPARSRTSAPILDAAGLVDRDDLLHCTRAANAPWPGQSESDYFDELILGRPEADRSALATLLKIVAGQRLVAATRPVAGGPTAVSFTDVALADLPRLRVFRPHRGRWDFEPYGLAIRRQWLIERGARPVRYTDDPLVDSPDSAERAWSQPARSRGPAAIDWTVEREWRHPGDLCLEELPADAGLVFVPSRAEAERVAAVSRWGVVVVGAT